jgi:hypothetical protein
VKGSVPFLTAEARTLRAPFVAPRTPPARFARFDVIVFVAPATAAVEAFALPFVAPAMLLPPVPVGAPVAELVGLELLPGAHVAVLVVVTVAIWSSGCLPFMCAEFELGWISTNGFVLEPVWCQTPTTVVVVLGHVGGVVGGVGAGVVGVELPHACFPFVPYGRSVSPCPFTWAFHE